ncbi:hypothetical protein So717_25890 [Roseobacter cerasinus]|uniref:Uncharacterized protein n=1 Tax=Roseobacter cerasinus TaxID=2602289 RepID=A0A640VX87_9RHOB|nr:hypothetical protein [Roseobacter cerasinus]GFE50836.1 hypothetical protein So717_25890 [Roseobacter cerasinus]
MEQLRMTTAIILGMRNVMGRRSFDEIPTLFHYFMALNFGAMLFLLKQLADEAFPIYYGLLKSESAASFFTKEALASTALVVFLGCILFWLGVKIARHSKVIVDHGMKKQGRQ